MSAGIQPGDVVAGRFQVGALVGEGGMARVFRSWDRQLDRWVALKAMLPVYCRDPEALEEMKSEVRLARPLSHVNIVSIYDFHVHSGVPAIVMEFVNGEPMDRYIAGQPGARLSGRTFLHFAGQMLAAVEYAHQAGVIHRDLKPANVMVEPSLRIKVMDFGIAMATRGNAPTKAGLTSGFTVQYCSPEQLQGERPAPGMDIYSLGCVFYHMLTGDPPFTKGDVRTCQLQTRPAPMSQVSRALNQVVLKCLEKDARARYPSVAALRRELTGGTTVIAAPAPAPPALARAATAPTPPPSPSRRGAPSAEFVLLHQGRAERVIPLPEFDAQGELEIGRGSKGASGGIRIPDPSSTLSRRQARLAYTASSGELRLVNLAGGNANPTRINGRALGPLESCPLRDGDTITMGNLQMVFRRKGSGRPPA
jgi:serine/threonine-protein kinase